MIIPTRVVRCDRCGSKIIAAHAEVTTRAFDGDPLTFVCADSILCQESQAAPPTVTVVIESGGAANDLPF